MGILDKFVKNKFYLELDDDKETYKWPTKIFEKTKSKQTDSEKSTVDKVSLDGDGGESEGIEKSKDSTEVSQPTTQVADTSYREEPAWIKSLYLSKEEKENMMPVEKTFAAESAIAKPRPNRRPGGSINKFRSLARELK